MFGKWPEGICLIFRNDDRAFPFALKVPATLVPAKFKIHIRCYGDMHGSAKALLLAGIEDFSGKYLPIQGALDSKYDVKGPPGDSVHALFYVPLECEQDGPFSEGAWLPYFLFLPLNVSVLILGWEEDFDMQNPATSSVRENRCTIWFWVWHPGFGSSSSTQLIKAQTVKSEDIKDKRVAFTCHKILFKIILSHHVLTFAFFIFMHGKKDCSVH